MSARELSQESTPRTNRERVPIDSPNRNGSTYRSTPFRHRFDFTWLNGLLRQGEGSVLGGGICMGHPIDRSVPGL